MKKIFTDEEKARRVSHFRRVVRYRSMFGWLFSIVGVVLFFVGLKNGYNLMIMINGGLFAGYGVFMVWQAKKVARGFDQN